MTVERIADLRRLCDAASEGPWTWTRDRLQGPTLGVVTLEGDEGDSFTLYCDERDRAFIARAREALPEALAELAALRLIEQDARMMRAELDSGHCAQISPELIVRIAEHVDALDAVRQAAGVDGA